MVAISLIFVSVLTLVGAKPTVNNFVVRDRRANVPQGFVRDAAASPSTSINLRIALKANDRAGLEKALYDVSTPGNELYGQHLSKEEVEAFVKPSSDTADAVNKWLTSNGLKASPVTPAGDWISFDVDVKKANELLDADFATFTHQSTGQKTIRTLSYSLPASLKDHINVVHPTTAFPKHSPDLPLFFSPLPKSSNVTAAAVPASCASVITPACLQALYGIPAAPARQASNKLAVSGFILQHANQADLRSFLTALRPDVNPATTFTVQTLDGGVNTQNDPGIEANLDTQYTTGVATGVPISFISVGEQNPDGVSGFIDIVNFLLAESAIPQVLTTSYGFNEPELPADLANTMCDGYMQLGARGVSVFFSSGDGGVSGSQSQACTQFIPTFPSGCPFVTSVGATTGINPEVSATFSSGGFSGVFPIPSYQSAAVSGYLSALGGTNAGLFNRAGRAFPDISAQGQNVEIAFGGQFGTVDGTSCSSPIFASLVSLLNDELIGAGKSPLGFLNPFLYSAAGVSALNDIVRGNNPGCNTNGFPALAGWDPVTGLGTPNYAALRTAVGL